MTRYLNYLEAKKSLDDTAIDCDVLTQVFSTLPPEPTILEIGTGTGTMIDRILDWELLTDGSWIAIDSNDKAISMAKNKVTTRPKASSAKHGVDVGNLTIEFVTDDAFTAIRQQCSADIIIGCAFFDLIDVQRLLKVGEQTEFVYAPITYNGRTIFYPAHPADAEIIAAYHRHMRTYRPGTSHGGVALLQNLSEVISVGNSTWRISCPYTQGERLILSVILETIENAVSEFDVDTTDWVETRQAQCRAGELRYQADNLDIFGRI